MRKSFVELQDQFRLKLYEMAVINMNNSVSVIAVEDGLGRTLDRQ